MNQNLQNIRDVILQNGKMNEDEKNTLLKFLQDADKELMITAFKLERTEKVKKTTAILLEETIEELEQKRKAVEEQSEIIKAENERKSIELEEARQLQLSMLPKKLPQLPNLDIAVYMQTATEVGGDYYDFKVADDGTLTAVIGDATGHGMKAGTIVTITKSLFNSLANEDNILDTFSKISRVIKDMKFRQLSMCLMMLKIKDNELKISSAAIPHALIYRKNINMVEELKLDGMPLGAMYNYPYQIEHTNISKGDTILLMSDGFPELHNDKNEMYGYNRVKSAYAQVVSESPGAIIDYLKDECSNWLNGKEPYDDVTFVVIKIK